MKIEFQGSISDSKGAIRRSGALSGGGNIVFDVPEAFIDCLAALMPLVLLPLRVTVELADPDSELFPATGSHENQVPQSIRKKSGRRALRSAAGPVDVQIPPVSNKQEAGCEDCTKLEESHLDGSKADYSSADVKPATHQNDSATERHAADVLAEWKAQKAGRKPIPRPQI